MRRHLLTIVLIASSSASTTAQAQYESPKRIAYREGMPIYAGYHLVERRNTALIVAGASSLGGGAFWIGFGAVVADRGGTPNFGPFLMVAGGAVAIAGLTLLTIGLSTKRKLLVRDDVATIVPVVADGTTGLALVGRF